MSTQNKLAKLITRFEIGFDNKTKVEIDSLKGKLDELTRALSVKNDTHADRLLAAMQADAANDAPQPGLKELGQWVFKGQPDYIKSAAIDGDGLAYLYNCPKSELGYNSKSNTHYTKIGDFWENIPGRFNVKNHRGSAIDRKTVNDVDYLSGNDLDECVPHIDDVLDQPNWLSGSVPQITQADMQLIFIKNLSETLIQRMHSTNRFSEDDYAIGGDKLMAWDIVFDQVSKFFGVVINANDNILSAFFLNDHCEMTGGGCARNFHKNSLLSRANRTITEAELPAFRTALEAYYA